MAKKQALLVELDPARRPEMAFGFMECALADPESGYYAVETVRAGRTGDFITAPELHPLLGSALARLVAAAWERLGAPRPFRWIEFGAGSGTLLVAALDRHFPGRRPALILGILADKDWSEMAGRLM